MVTIPHLVVVTIVAVGSLLLCWPLAALWQLRRSPTCVLWAVMAGLVVAEVVYAVSAYWATEAEIAAFHAAPICPAGPGADCRRLVDGRITRDWWTPAGKTRRYNLRVEFPDGEWREDAVFGKPELAAGMAVRAEVWRRDVVALHGPAGEIMATTRNPDYGRMLDSPALCLAILIGLLLLASGVIGPASWREASAQRSTPAIPAQWARVGLVGMFGLLTAVALLLLGSSMGPAGAAQRAAGAPETAGGVPAPGDSARAAGSTAVAPAEPPTAAAAILWADDFSDPASGWSRQSSDPSKALVGYSYGSGEYYVVKVAGWRGSWVARSGRKFGDFQAEVDARLEPPAEGAYLFLTFRHQENRDQFQFGVDPHGGRFRLLRRVDDRFTSLIGWTEAAAIQGDTGLNRLGVLAQSPELVLLVNGEEVGRARDELWREGRVGLGVGHFQEERAEARFGSLLVVRADSPAS